MDMWCCTDYINYTATWLFETADLKIKNKLKQRSLVEL